LNGGLVIVQGLLSDLNGDIMGRQQDHAGYNGIFERSPETFEGTITRLSGEGFPTNPWSGDGDGYGWGWELVAHGELYLGLKVGKKGCTLLR